MNNIPNMELFLAQNGNCFYCGKPMWAARTKPGKNDSQNGWTVDHFLPKCRGNGKTGNKVLSCQQCNRKKGSRMPTPDEFKRFNTLYQKVLQRRIRILREK